MLIKPVIFLQVKIEELSKLQLIMLNKNTKISGGI